MSLSPGQRRVLEIVREYRESQGRGVAAQLELSNPFTRHVPRTEVWDLALRRASTRHFTAVNALNALTVAEVDALLSPAEAGG